MKYTEEFKDRVKKLYPNSKQMHEMLDNGNAFLGRLLDDNSPSGISNETILKAKSLTELQQLATTNQAKIQLYKDYWEQPKE